MFAAPSNMLYCDGKCRRGCGCLIQFGVKVSFCGELLLHFDLKAALEQALP